MTPSDSIPGRFDFIACSSTLNHQETNHTSLLFSACLNFQCWTNTLYTTLTSRAIKKQLCAPVSFHYACLLSYRWQYRYVTTVLPVFASNVFHGGCSVFISLPLIIQWPSGKEAHAACLPIFFKIFRKCLILNKCYPKCDSI